MAVEVRKLLRARGRKPWKCFFLVFGKFGCLCGRSNVFSLNHDNRDGTPRGRRLPRLPLWLPTKNLPGLSDRIRACQSVKGRNDGPMARQVAMNGHSYVLGPFGLAVSFLFSLQNNRLSLRSKPTFWTAAAAAHILLHIVLHIVFPIILPIVLPIVTGIGFAVGSYLDQERTQGWWIFRRPWWQYAMTHTRHKTFGGRRASVVSARRTGLP